MGKIERLAAARERVRKWKATHPKSVEWQRKRWYARKKGKGKAAVMEAVAREQRATGPMPRYGELHRGDIEGVDVGYGLMEPEGKGGPGIYGGGIHAAKDDELKGLGQAGEPGV